MSASVLNTESIILESKLKINSTPRDGGSVLDILKPFWQKALESEMRISFIKNMLDRDLVMRDVLKFGRIIEEKLRAESSRDEELGRRSLIEIMKVKLTDEKRFYRECRKVRETLRDYVRRNFGRKYYTKQMEKLKPSLEKRKIDLKEKYLKKMEHLAAQREREKREKLENVPSGLEKYSSCNIFNKEKMSTIKPQEIKHKLIGEVQISEEERSVLNLNPKFAVMKKLENINMEQDIELGLAKLRYEVARINKRIKEEEIEETNYGISRSRKRMKLEESSKEDEREIMQDAKSRQIFDPLTFKFNYTKKCATDLKENKSVTLPKGVDDRIESEMTILKELLMKEFKSYKREIETKEIKEGKKEGGCR